MRIIARGFVPSRSRLLGYFLILQKLPSFLRRDPRTHRRERKRERESRISLLDRARMQVPFVLIFYLTEEKSSLLVPIRKSAGKKRVFQYLPFLPCWALLTRGACARFFRVASRGSLTFELSNRPDAVSEYCPVIAPGYGSSDAMRRDAILRSKLIQSRDSLNSSIIIQIWIWHLPVKYSLSC